MHLSELSIMHQKNNLEQMKSGLNFVRSTLPFSKDWIFFILQAFFFGKFSDVEIASDLLESEVSGNYFRFGEIWYPVNFVEFAGWNKIGNWRRWIFRLE